jgi:hypothetical protein
MSNDDSLYVLIEALRAEVHALRADLHDITRAIEETGQHIDAALIEAARIVAEGAAARDEE